MRIDTGQHLRLEQKMKLAPRMIQSMEILQMSALALQAKIDQELESNPTLEVREAGPDTEQLEEEQSQIDRDNQEGERDLVVNDDAIDTAHTDDFERLNNITEEYGDSWEANTYETGETFRPRVDSGERDIKIDAMANTAARPQSLTEQLLEQWHLVDTPQAVRVAGEFLVEFIDDDGYLRTDWQTLLEQVPANIDHEDLGTALALMKETFEPTGIGAHDLRECLLLQIDALVRNNGRASQLSVERLLVDQYLKDVEQNRLPRIAQATNLDIEDIKIALKNLRRFDPHPGRNLVSKSAQRITPDVIVDYDEENDLYLARLARDRNPSLQVSMQYQKMQRDKAVDSKTRKFVGNHIQSARWLIDALEQRGNTLLRVAKVVIEAQRDFFDQGPQALHPLPMTLVADQLGIHVATVSRAVNEKYLQTPQGIFPLRKFFSGGTETESGDAMSWSAVQAKLEEVINEEDKSKPLNDDQLVEKLKLQGIDIARRTVAKYRKQLNIPAARQRRQY